MIDNIWGVLASGSPSATAATKATAATTASGSSSSSKSSSGSTGLDKQAFLELLTTQMSNQDPLNPTDSQDYFMQLAQLTSLEQLWTLNDNMSSMMRQQSLLQASNLIGSTVAGTTESGTSTNGVVTGVMVNDDVVYLVVGDSDIPVSNITAVVKSTT